MLYKYIIYFLFEKDIYMVLKTGIFQFVCIQAAKYGKGKIRCFIFWCYPNFEFPRTYLKIISHQKTKSYMIPTMKDYSRTTNNPLGKSR